MNIVGNICILKKVLYFKNIKNIFFLKLLKLGYKWSDFIKRYKAIISRLQKLKGNQKVSFEFSIDEAVEFIRKENSK